MFAVISPGCNHLEMSETYGSYYFGSLHTGSSSCGSILGAPDFWKPPSWVKQDRVSASNHFTRMLVVSGRELLMKYIYIYIYHMLHIAYLISYTADLYTYDIPYSLHNSCHITYSRFCRVYYILHSVHFLQYSITK